MLIRVFNCRNFPTVAFPQLNTRINIVERVTKYYTVGTFLQLNTRINIVERVTKYYTVGTIPKSNIKILERGKIGNPTV
jgi:hypothetical protein